MGAGRPPRRSPMVRPDRRRPEIRSDAGSSPFRRGIFDYMGGSRGFYGPERPDLEDEIRRRRPPEEKATFQPVRPDRRRRPPEVPVRKETPGREINSRGLRDQKFAEFLKMMDQRRDIRKRRTGGKPKTFRRGVRR